MDVIDAWAQHPTPRHIGDPMFASLRRWTKIVDAENDQEIPLSTTLGAMDAGGVSRALISAWYAPKNILISNDEVASFVSQAPDRLVGVGSVDISRPMEAVTEIRRCVSELGFKAIRKHENVFIDTSAYTVQRYPAQLVDYMKSHGREKVLFGTNYPMIQPAKALGGLEKLGLSDEVASLFLAGNTRRVFGL